VTLAWPQEHPLKALARTLRPRLQRLCFARCGAAGEPTPGPRPQRAPVESWQRRGAAPLAGQGVVDFAWAKHWVKYGLEHLEAELAGRGAGKFCHGDSPTMADACLVPQLWNAVHRYQTPLGPFPRLASIWENCLEVEAFQAAMPERQAGYQAPAPPPAAA